MKIRKSVVSVLGDKVQAVVCECSTFIYI